jgi:Glycosyl hydrolase family 3 C-terminal domain
VRWPRAVVAAWCRDNPSAGVPEQELIDQIKATGKPFVVVLFNGRPLTLANVAASSPAILEAWFPGVEAGNAAADVLFGKVNPGGKQPVSFPRTLGQIAIYYNHEPTGRPCDPGSKYNSRYRDLASCDPLYLRRSTGCPADVGRAMPRSERGAYMMNATPTSQIGAPLPS